jgi:hypothetical protein
VLELGARGKTFTYRALDLRALDPACRVGGPEVKG